MGLHLAEGLLREALSTLRSCGAGARECVCWLTGPLDQPDLVDELLHPSHTASAGGYLIDDVWITETWLALARRRRELRLQLHTHPGRAYHSATDDSYPAVDTAGYLSLVIPDFAVGVEDLRGAYLAERTPDGGWRPLDPAEGLVVA
jgi:hypothetical protein